MTIKTLIHTLIILAIIGTFGYYIIFEKQGIKHYFQLKKERDLEKENIQELEYKIAILEKELYKIQTDPLEKEKIAREKLQMSLANEYIYVITPTASTSDSEISETFGTSGFGQTG